MSEDNHQTKSPRRFIAGAVCPQCRALDRLVISQINEQTQQRDCVSCGFSDQTSNETSAAIPWGKVEKAALPKETLAQNVRLIDPRSEE